MSGIKVDGLKRNQSPARPGGQEVQDSVQSTIHSFLSFFFRSTLFKICNFCSRLGITKQEKAVKEDKEADTHMRFQIRIRKIGNP